MLSAADQQHSVLVAQQHSVLVAAGRETLAAGTHKLGVSGE